jgi:hypothetical protein
MGPSLSRMRERGTTNQPLSRFMGEGGARAERGKVRVAGHDRYRPNKPEGRTTSAISNAPNATAGDQDGP